jgi:hypothetical protein
MRLHDRRDAGRLLAERLSRNAARDDVLVLALPRDGVPVAYKVARALGAPLDVFVVRKLDVPGHEELAFGAVASGGIRVLNDEVVATLGLDEQSIEGIAERELSEVERRERLYRGERPRPDLRGKVVVLVDDQRRGGARAVAGGSSSGMNPLSVDETVARIACAAGDTRFVPIGEASHGTDEFYELRAGLTKRLIEEPGFCAVAARGRLA